MKRKKMLAVAAVIIVLSITLITAAAVTIYKYSEADGKMISKTVNRVNIEVANTEFTFDKPDDSGALLCTTTVSIEKTEPDFYGLLNSITLSGQEFEYTLYTAGKDNGDSAVLPQNVTLPVKDGETYPLTWEISFAVPYEEGKNEYNVSLDINYTTGLKSNATQRYLTSVPINITVNN